MVDFAKLLQLHREGKMPKIPVSIDNLSTSYTLLDTAIPYNGIVRKCRLADKTDKSGNNYLTGIEIEVIEPEEWRGKTVFVNYICLPSEISANMGVAERRKAEDQGVMLARFVKAFKVPYTDEGIDPDDCVGCEGQFTVKEGEYNGKPKTEIDDFLID